jgi:hypothetical protein
MPPMTGKLVYIKASVTSDAPVHVLNYARAHDSFPHQSTADQFFDDTQFEAYRALGEHIALLRGQGRSDVSDARAALGAPLTAPPGLAPEIRHARDRPA